MKSNIKSILVFIFLIGMGRSSAQQLEVEINVFPPFQLTLDGLTNQLLATVTNTTTQPHTFNFRLDMHGPKGLRISSDRVFDVDMDIESGEVLQFRGEDWEELFGSINLTIQPASEEQRLIDTQAFREGSYQICLIAYDTSTNVQLSNGSPDDCTNFTVEVPEIPQIVIPIANSEIEEVNLPLNIVWAPQQTTVGETTYEIEIVDVTENPGRSDDELFSVGIIEFRAEDINTFSYLIDEEEIDWENGHTYVVRVSSVTEYEDANTPVILHSRPVRFKFIGDVSSEGEADIIELVSGGSQNGSITTALENPVEVIVKDLNDNPVSGVTVNFSTTHGSVSSASTTTDENGIAQTQWTLGSTVGEHTLIATAFKEDGITALANSPLTILATAADKPPVSLAVTDTIYAGRNGEFSILVSQITKAQEKYTGKGTVHINWLQARVNISFKDITLDSNKKLLTGNIIADISENPPVYPKDWALEAVTNNTWTNSIAGDIVNWVEGITGQSLPYNNPNELSTPVNMPLGVTFNVENQLVLTEMVFGKDESKFNIVAAKSTPLEWGEPQTVGFIAKEIKFHPTSIEPSPKRLELVADVTLENLVFDTDYSFIAPSNTRTGCYIEWDENGFSNFGLELDSKLSRDWLVPSDKTNLDKVTISLSAQGADWDDILFTGNLPESIIVGTGGIKISAKNIAYDMSDVLNPTGITFPANYQGDTSNQFRGFYAQNLKLKLPEAWETSSSGALDINVNNMIIDNMGLTMKVEAVNIADFNTTSVVNMAASIDNVKVEVIANSLTEASIEGKLALPISDVSEITNKSKIDYSASLHIVSNQQNNSTEDSYFQLTLNPTIDQEINFDLISSKFKIDNTSNVTARVGSDKIAFDADLSGEINMTGIDIGPIALNSTKMNVEHVNFGYDSRPGKGFYFDKNKTMRWAFNSPQKKLSSTASNKGFSINILNIDYENKTTEANEAMRGALLIETNVILSNDIGGAGTIAIIGAIKEAPNSFAKFKPKYVTTQLEKISVEAALSTVKIKGELELRENDPVYGDGFTGELQAQFTTLKAGVNASAEFGTVKDFNYWRVQAGLDLPTPIVLAAGISFHSFGGGAYYNMKATKTSNNDASWGEKYTFTPKKDLAGLNLMARLGAPKIETYNADVEISAAIGTEANAGLKEINFTGNLWVGAAVADRNKAPIKGQVEVKYDFVDDIFDLSTNATVNMKAITAKDVNMKIHANGTTDKWYFKFGDPQHPNTINVNLLGLGVDVQSYFMFGNDIPIPVEFTPRFRNGYKAALGRDPSITPKTEATSEGNNASKGAGIALGVGFNFHAGGYIPLGFGYHGGIGGTAGAELNLSLLEYPNLKAKNLGYNGWQAGGSIGFYADVGAGVFRKSGQKYNSVFKIANFAAGGYIAGRFPNPEWAKGEVSGRVKILCFFGKCLINTHVDVGFEYGEIEPPGAPNIEVVEAIEEELTIESRDRVVENIDTHIVKYIHPKTPFSFSPTSPIAIKYYMAPNEVFELPDLGRLRHFYFHTTMVLEEINPLTCQVETLQLNVTTNEAGEKIYTANSKLNWLEKGAVQNFQNNNLPTLTGHGFNNINASSNTIKNNLAPQTNYRLVIHVVLKERINSRWESTELDGKIIEETMEYKFRTGGNPTNELIQADALFTQMPINTFFSMSIADRHNFTINQSNLTINPNQSNITTNPNQLNNPINPNQSNFTRNPDRINNTRNPNQSNNTRNFAEESDLMISEDGKCECKQLKASDKLTIYTSYIASGRLASLPEDFPKPYRNYPPVKFSDGAIRYLAAYDPNTNSTNINVNQYNTGSISTSVYSPNTFNYSTLNTANSGSFLSLR